jgi:hypothetical protein
MKTFIEDEEFGKIYVELRRGMTSVRFTHHNDGSLLMRAPLGAPIDDLKRIIDTNREKLRELHQPDVPDFYFGQVIEGFRCHIVIEPTSPEPGYIQACWQKDTLQVQVHESEDLTKFKTKESISKLIGNALEIVAIMKLLPFAQEVANGLGLSPAGFELGRGMRKLGHCTNKRVIQLSRNLVLLPEELVRYIICHELAHLTHMNHSPEFHALCNQYCNGQEKALEQQLRQFRWPILK